MAHSRRKRTRTLHKGASPTQPIAYSSEARRRTRTDATARAHTHSHTRTRAQPTCCVHADCQTHCCAVDTASLCQDAQVEGFSTVHRGGAFTRSTRTQTHARARARRNKPAQHHARARALPCLKQAHRQPKSPLEVKQRDGPAMSCRSAQVAPAAATHSAGTKQRKGWRGRATLVSWSQMGKRAEGAAQWHHRRRRATS